MVYYGIVLLLAVFSFLGQLGIKRKYLQVLFPALFWFAVSIIFIVGGFRENVGTDWVSYEGLFNSLHEIEDALSAREETLFVFLMLALKRIYDSYYFFVLLAFALAFFSKVSVIQHYSMDSCLSLMVYLYTVFMIYDINGLRYGLALSCFLLAIPSIIDRKLGRYILLCALACGFHLSAIVILPFYWLARLRLSAKLVGVSVLVVLPCSLLMRATIEGKVLQLLTSFDLLSHYIVYLVDAGSGRDIEMASMAGLHRVLTLLLAVFALRRVDGRDDLQRLLRNGYAISVVIFAAFSFAGEFATRVSYFYKSLEMILIPEIVSSQKNRVMRLMLLGYFVVSAFLAVGRLLSIPEGDLLPYHSMLENLW